MQQRLEFTIRDVDAVLEDFAPTTERLGDGEFAPATDLKLSMNLDASILDFFEPQLRAYLFDENGPRDLADSIPLRDSHMVYPLKRDEEMDDATVRMGWGIGEPMVLEGCKVSEFRLTPMAGSIVVVLLKIRCKPTKEQAGELYIRQKKTFVVSVEPAALPVMGEAAAA